MFRSFMLLILGATLLSVPLPYADAQHAYCDCCGQLYRVPGAKWIGASRGYGGICSNCRGHCLDCSEQADDLRNQYQTWLNLRNRGGHSVVMLSHINQLIDRMHQRWSDLRYACLAAGGSDPGPMHEDAPEPPPSRGLKTPESKNRFRQRAAEAESMLELELLFGEHGQLGTSAIAETVRTRNVFDYLANDPPDPNYKTVVQPKIELLPKISGRMDEQTFLKLAVLTKKNANSYAEAYITSFERFQAATKAGDKKAAHLQVGAMGRFSFQAIHNVKHSGVYAHQWQKMYLERLKLHRADLARKGVKWQDEWKSAHRKLLDQWPMKTAPMLTKAGMADKEVAAIHMYAVGLTAQKFDAILADRKAKVGFDDAAIALLKKTKAKTTWPQPQAMDVYEMMAQHAHVLHAEMRGRRKELDKDRPFGARRASIAGWGMLTDPVGKCTATLDKARLIIKLPPGHFNLNPASGYNMLGPRVLRSVEGDFTFQVKVGVFARPKPKTAVAGHSVSYAAAGVIVWQNARTFLRAFRAANGDRGDVFFHVEGFQNGSRASIRYYVRNVNERNIEDKPLHIRVERKGNELTIYRSADGTSWSKFATMRDTRMPKGVSVGVGAVNTTRSGFAPQFEDLQLKRGA